MRWLSLFGSWLFSRRIERDLARVWRLVLDHPEPVVLALGVLLRFATYWENRTFWFDESSLWGNIAGKPILDFSQPLAGDQLAPLGFLMAQRALVSELGTSRYVARLIPLASGLVALGLFSRLARGILSRRGALVALILFAFTDDLVYYSSEMKPYSLDLAVGLALTLAAQGALAVPLSFRRAAAMGIAVLVAPWCSFASAFVVAGCGATLILFSLLSRRYGDAAVWVAVGTGWGASFAIAYQASLTMLSPSTSMYQFWWFAFLPIWPLSLENLARAAGILLEIFVNPLNLVGPIWPWVGVVLPLSLALAGSLSLARRSWPAWAILVLPIALAIVASGMKRYPFHGRLILELVPAFFLLIAQGTEQLRELAAGRARLSYKAVLVVLLAYPCLASIYQAAGAAPREFNRHGDLRKNLFIQ